jgi:hypothetical protein
VALPQRRAPGPDRPQGSSAARAPVLTYITDVFGKRGRRWLAELKLSWQLLTTQQDYAYQRPTLVARKLRTLQLRAGEPHATTPPPPGPRRATATQLAARERDLAAQAEPATGA